MNHLGQLFLVCMIVFGISLIFRSRRNVKKFKRDSLDAVAKIQTDATLSQNEKDTMILSWVKSLGETNRLNSQFGDACMAVMVFVIAIILVRSV